MKKIALLTLSMLSTLSTYAQMFGNGASQLQSEVEQWFTPAISVIAIVGLLIIIGTCFVGENRDIKKGVAGIIILTVAVTVIVAAYNFISTQSL